MMITMRDVITLLVSVQNARVSSNAHPNRASPPPLDARFWPRLAPLHKNTKDNTTRRTRFEDKRTREKKRETKNDENDDTRARGKKKRKTKKKRRRRKTIVVVDVVVLIRSTTKAIRRRTLAACRTALSSLPATLSPW